jgi:hypothetical protein
VALTRQPRRPGTCQTCRHRARFEREARLPRMTFSGCAALNDKEGPDFLGARRWLDGQEPMTTCPSWAKE